MLKNLVTLTLISITAVNAWAGACETEMNSFTHISQPRKARICQIFKTDESFKIFQSCLVDTAKKFNSTVTIQDLRDLEEKDISGILTLCSGSSVTSAPSRATIRQ